MVTPIACRGCTSWDDATANLNLNHIQQMFGSPYLWCLSDGSFPWKGAAFQNSWSQWLHQHFSGTQHERYARIWGTLNIWLFFAGRLCSNPSRPGRTFRFAEMSMAGLPAARSQLEAWGLEVHRFDSPVKTPLTEAHWFFAKQHINPMGFLEVFFGSLENFQLSKGWSKKTLPANERLVFTMFSLLDETWIFVTRMQRSWSCLAAGGIGIARPTNNPHQKYNRRGLRVPKRPLTMKTAMYGLEPLIAFWLLWFWVVLGKVADRTMIEQLVYSNNGS